MEEAVCRMNILKSKKNFISFVSFFMLVGMLPFLFSFLFKYFSWYLVLVIVVYSMVIMGTHGTIWFHRYCTHKSFTFSHPLWRIITQNLVIKTVPEEIYVVSHHVHHQNLMNRVIHIMPRRDSGIACWQNITIRGYHLI